MGLPGGDCSRYLKDLSWMVFADACCGRTYYRASGPPVVFILSVILRCDGWVRAR